MKKIFLLPLMLLSFNLLAQIPMATGFIGGSLQLSSQTNNESTPSYSSTTTQFSLAPTLGFAICNNLELGIVVGYGANSNSNTQNTLKETSNNFSIGPYLNYYHQIKSNSNFYCEVGFEATYGTETSKNSDSGVVTSSSGYTNLFIGFSPGIAWKPTKHLLFKLNYGELGFNSESPMNETGSVNTFTFNVTPATLQFGFDYIFSFKHNSSQ